MNVSHMILFISVFLGVLAFCNLYVYRRFFRQLAPGWHRPGAILMALLTLGEAVYVLEIATGMVPESPALYLGLSTCIGGTFMLFVVALAYDLVVSVSRRVPFAQKRRRALKVVFDSTALMAAASYLVVGFAEGLRPPRINDVRIRIPDFPFQEFTIVQLSDVHVGRTIGSDFLETCVARINALQPDLVVITGDLYEAAPADLGEDLRPLKNLVAPTYFVTGNHEYYHGVEAALQSVQALGITPLANRSVPIGDPGPSFYLVGLNDLTGARFNVRPPDVEMAYRGVDPSKPVIVLSHQPKSAGLLGTNRCDLMLSGHTHGGQIFPFGLLVKLDQPFVADLHEFLPGKQIFVSRGTGYWGPPLRVLAPSEITRITITKADN